MPKDNNDNQLSTVLLLIALCSLIYFLTKPKSNNVCENTDQMEPYTNTGTNDVLESNVPNQPVSNQPVSNQPVSNQPVSNQPVSNQPVSNQPVSNIDNYETEHVIDKPIDVYHFEPVDVQEFGTNLDTAFERPITQSKQADSVDINKNNVSNYNAKDFLPNEINNEWFDTDFSQAKFNINDDKLINTDRYVIGINTVGQSLKNASYDIRGTIPNPKMTVSPWNNSTYEPDFNIKPLC
jgi:hypothetical protein